MIPVAPFSRIPSIFSTPPQYGATPPRVFSHIDACYFFYMYGGIGNNIEEILLWNPSNTELEVACEKALRNGRTIEEVNESKESLLWKQR